MVLSAGEAWDLLRAYVERRDERAFARLVAAHIDLVYSAAVRQVHDRQTAEDVCQGVFILLAHKAATLREDVILSAYLLKATYFISRNVIKRETSRRRYERKVAAMSARLLPNDVASNFSDLLDEGMNCLNDRERAAIVLRFFEERTLAEAGAALGVSEDAAAMRVSRAIGKLRRFFASRKMTLSALEAGVILSSVAVRRAPPHVAQAVTTGALLGVRSSSTLAAQLARDAAEAMAREKLKLILYWSAAGVAALIFVGFLFHLGYALTRPIPRPPTDVY